jgi:WD40 repeat protein
MIYTTGNGTAPGLDKNTIRLFRHDTGSVETVFFGHEDTITSLSINRQIPVFTSTGRDKRLYLWDDRSPHPAMSIQVQYEGNIK